MDFKQGIRTSLEMADFMALRLVADLTDEELLVRPVPEANHVAWQLGHAIWAEHAMIEAARPGSMPPLPEGFAERHGRGTSCTDNPEDYLPLEEYLELARKVRQATLAALDAMTDEDFNRPITGRVPPRVKCAGDLFVLAGLHWMHHTGQWVVLRRKLGRPRLM